MQPDHALAAVVGSQPLPRTELTKKLWNTSASTSSRTLPRRRDQCDDKLKAVFDGKAKVSMFEMTKLVSGHVK